MNTRPLKPITRILKCHNIHSTRNHLDHLIMICTAFIGGRGTMLPALGATASYQTTDAFQNGVSWYILCSFQPGTPIHLNNLAKARDKRLRLQDRIRRARLQTATDQGHSEMTPDGQTSLSEWDGRTSDIRNGSADCVRRSGAAHQCAEP